MAASETDRSIAATWWLHLGRSLRDGTCIWLERTHLTTLANWTTLVWAHLHYYRGVLEDASVRLVSVDRQELILDHEFKHIISESDRQVIFIEGFESDIFPHDIKLGSLNFLDCAQRNCQQRASISTQCLLLRVVYTDCTSGYYQVSFWEWIVFLEVEFVDRPLVEYCFMIIDQVYIKRVWWVKELSRRSPWRVYIHNVNLRKCSSLTARVINSWRWLVWKTKTLMMQCFIYLDSFLDF